MPFLTTKCDIFLFTGIQTKENEAFSLFILASLTAYRDYARLFGRHL